MEAQTTFLRIRPNLANLECSVPAVAMENKTRKAKEGLHLKKKRVSPRNRQDREYKSNLKGRNPTAARSQTFHGWCGRQRDCQTKGEASVIPIITDGRTEG